MRFVDEASEWKCIFDQGMVSLVRIDFRVTFVITDSSSTLEACIETPFRIAIESLDTICVPDDPRSLAPILPLTNARVESVVVGEFGHLTIDFGSNAAIKVNPDRSYEAWQLAASTGLLIVCSPGGKTVMFKKKDVLPRQS